MKEVGTINPPLQNQVVSQQEWTEAHAQFLKESKELTRLYDRHLERLRQLPWKKVEKEYVFKGASGYVSLSDLFAGRNQLMIQHFMFGPDALEGCVGCSFGADHVDSARQHFEHNDLSYAVVSRAPIEKLLAFQMRMGWRFNWVSSFNSDFNYDFHVSFTSDELARGRGYYNFQETDVDGEEASGRSVFYKDPQGNIYHTYSAYGRGDERLIGAYNFLDMTPLGRNEAGANKNLTDWVRHHDKYHAKGFVDNTGRYHEVQTTDSCCSPQVAK
jgi:predicted dithiol-disulfide oxidoreductase (DUF899 family)